MQQSEVVDGVEMNARLDAMVKAFRETGRHTEIYGTSTDPEWNLNGPYADADPESELQFNFSDALSMKLFLAVCRKHGVRVFRYSRQRKTTIMVRVHEREFRRTAWMENSMLEEKLMSFLEGIVDHLFGYLTAGPDGDGGQPNR